MMSASSAPVLVTGATGRQGGAAVRALLAAGVPVRALVRDPDSARAQAVAECGAELVTGDLEDLASVRRAAEGARAVFSVQTPDSPTYEREQLHAGNLVDAAREAGVKQFVHTSVSGAGQHETMPGWAEGRWAELETYYWSKAAIQDRVRAAGFPRWTLLKPGLFMENFLPLSPLLPQGPKGGLMTLIKPEREVALVACEDIGRAAAAAVLEPDRFHQVELELASDHPTMEQVAQTFSRVFGTAMEAPVMTEEEMLDAGTHPGWTRAQDLLATVGYPARPENARAFGIPLTSFAEWVERHRYAW